MQTLTLRDQRIEFYIGLCVWALDIVVAYGMWLSGDKVADISRAITLANFFLVAALYVVFLAGYLLSNKRFAHGHQIYLVWIGVFLSSLSVVGLTVFFFFGMVALLSTIVLIQLVHYLSEKQALFLAVSIPSAGVLIDVLLGRVFEYPIIIIYGTFNLLAVITHFRLVSEREAKAQSEQLVRELKATQMLLSATTKRDERIRIARELHDSLGHQLTALKLQLEVAGHIAESQRQKHLQQAKEISESLLSEVRSTVSEFRNRKDFDLINALEVLTHDLPNLHIDLDIDLNNSDVNAKQAEVIFRCIQEALTNCLKHSNGNRCSIVISADQQTLTLIISDNGKNLEPVRPGNGIKGMRERIMSVGGTLSFEVQENSFQITATLPLD
ncbi:MAG: sensor histidine kinase [Pseudomonadales bacterium]|nr:sensor histidine kinase [Pseudomonadales bacterium]